MDKTDTSRALLEQLRPFVESVATTRLARNKYFSLCLRASFSKAFEFVDCAFKRSNNDQAFYHVAALRSICEDIIYLSFATRLSPQDRETLIKGLMLLELQERIRRQVNFFQKFRPLQPVLDASVSPRELEKTKQEIRSIWQANGWPNMKTSVTPATRDIAEKIDPGVLDIVYDYIFRLTSSMVHFSPHILLRTGWGDMKNTITFSTKNMNSYYMALARVYGGFLFCLYFENFRRFLRPGAAYQEIVAALREDLVMQSRWPEMVTFEEMNLELTKTNPLEILGRLLLAEQAKSGFMAAAKKQDA